MKEVVVGMILMFGATVGVFAFLGGGENRNIGFNNGQCPKTQQFCGVTWNED
jgi:hypothetical protein